MASVFEGFVHYQPKQDVSTCRTYYKVIGGLQKGKAPLVALHGGPGVNHTYLLVLADVTTSLGTSLVLYDQIGTGRSTHYPEKMGDTSFWTDDLFLGELDNLLKHLDIANGYNLIGHSWGGMLAARHAVRQPPGLKKLVLMSTPADMQLWIKSQNYLRSQLPQDIQDVLDKHEKENTTQLDEYQGAVGAFYSRHLCILKPMPEVVAAGFAEISNDPTVYLTMNGPSEFRITGPLANWTIIDDASKISVPTLLTNGRFDEAQDEVVRPFFEKIGKVKWAKFSESSHMAHHEERERYMQELKSFLRGSD